VRSAGGVHQPRQRAARQAAERRAGGRPDRACQRDPKRAGLLAHLPYEKLYVARVWTSHTCAHVIRNVFAGCGAEGPGEAVTLAPVVCYAQAGLVKRGLPTTRRNERRFVLGERASDRRIHRVRPSITGTRLVAISRWAALRSRVIDQAMTRTPYASASPFLSGRWSGAERDWCSCAHANDNAGRRPPSALMDTRWNTPGISVTIQRRPDRW
jgi:hypothetical protein